MGSFLGNIFWFLQN